MKKLFEPVNLGGIELKNRLVRSATFEANGGRDGLITFRIRNAMKELAEGGVGLIITGMMGVSTAARLSRGMVDISDERFLEGCCGLVDAVHRAGGKIVVQLSHCGVKVEKDPVGPSDYEDPKGRWSAKAMTVEQIRQLAEDFAAAAQKCKQAGADGVQLHGAHGYLLSQFLSPHFNRRDDAYGGSIENRSRLLLEVYEAVRRRVGDSYPVLVKINYTDLVEDGLSGEECLWVCRELDKRSINAIEVSAGIAVSRASSPTPPVKEEGLFTEGALHIAAEVKAPVFSVGGYRSPEGMEAALNRGNLAAVSVSRPLIRQPDLPKRWQAGDALKPDCISCSKCFLSPVYGCHILLSRQMEGSV